MSNLKYIFVIDTNKYAGNFERELTGYCTGHVGECDVGDDQAVLFEEEVGSYGDEIFPNILQVPDDNGCWRPCYIWKTPGRKNDGYGGHSDGEGGYPAYESVAIFFESPLTDDQVKLLEERAKKFCDREDIQIRGFRILKEQTTIETVTTIDFIKEIKK